MGRSPRRSRDEGLNRVAWTMKEDMILRDYINIHGVESGWRSVRDKTGSHSLQIYRYCFFKLQCMIEFQRLVYR